MMSQLEEQISTERATGLSIPPQNLSSKASCGCTDQRLIFPFCLSTSLLIIKVHSPFPSFFFSSLLLPLFLSLTQVVFKAIKYPEKRKISKRFDSPYQNFHSRNCAKFYLQVNKNLMQISNQNAQYYLLISFLWWKYQREVIQ